MIYPVDDRQWRTQVCKSSGFMATLPGMKSISHLSSSDLAAVDDVGSHAAEEFFGSSELFLCSSNHKSQFTRTSSTNTCDKKQKLQKETLCTIKLWFNHSVQLQKFPI